MFIRRAMYGRINGKTRVLVMVADRREAMSREGARSTSTNAHGDEPT
jgi:hypothetical protein